MLQQLSAIDGLEDEDRVDLQLAREAIETKTARRRTIREELKKMKEKERSLIAEINIDKERFKLMVDARAWPGIREIMVLVDEKLPRELRDMVYGYLGISGHRIHLNPLRGVQPANDSRIPHTDSSLFSAHFVTRAVASEIQEFYWSSNFFELDISPDAKSGISAALNIGGSGEDASPRMIGSPYKNIGHLRVNLRCEKWGKCRWCHSRDDRPGCSPYYSSDAMDRLEAKLEPLLKFKAERQILIEFVIHTNIARIRYSYEDLVTRQRHWVNMLESIRKCFFTLKHSGVRVEVFISDKPLYDQMAMSVIETDFYEDFAEDWDLTSHLTLSADKWLEEKEQERAQPKRASEHHISNRNIAADLGGFYDRLERRWGLCRPPPWMENVDEML